MKQTTTENHQHNTNFRISKFNTYTRSSAVADQVYFELCPRIVFN